MDNKNKIQEVILILENEYPSPECTLNYNSPIQLIIAARLSAQCTDARVNLVTPKLFSLFKDIEDFANADLSVIEECIKSCGFYKVKSQNIVDMCKKLISDFNGKIPDNIDDLTTLPGIGRKTANLILAEVYGIPGIIVDTHFSRVTRRLGFHNLKDPTKIELVMKNIVPQEKSNDFCHRMVEHGRKICKAQKPLCEKCVLNGLCSEYRKSSKI